MSRARWIRTSLAGAALLAMPISVQAQTPEETAYATGTLKLPAELVTAACKEGHVTFYSLIFDSIKPTSFQKFHERFPCIELSTFNASSGALAQRFTSEFQAGTRNADLLMNSSPSYGKRMIAAGMLAQWTPPTGDLVPAQWQDPGYWYSVGLSYIGMAWNKQEIDDKQKAWLGKTNTWKEVLDAPFKDNLAMVNIRAGGSTQMPYQYLKVTFGIESWKKLAALKPTIFNGINPLADRLAAGEFALTPAATIDTAIGARWAQGAPLQWKFPEPGLAVPYFLAVTSNAPHPNAAKVFLAWSLSEEGQSAWVNGSGLAPASTHVNDQRAFTKEAWYKLPKQTYAADWDKIDADAPELNKDFDRIFGH
jgi:iron(III) transport system substrate-binding protein